MLPLLLLLRLLLMVLGVIAALTRSKLPRGDESGETLLLSEELRRHSLSPDDVRVRLRPHAASGAESNPPVTAKSAWANSKCNDAALDSQAARAASLLWLPREISMSLNKASADEEAAHAKRRTLLPPPPPPSP
jgi:hypothetical protein